jgi:putative endonuclease
LTNTKRSVLYVGVTNDLRTRLNEHYENTLTRSGFTGKYFCYYLVYYERHDYVEYAIEREKEIKKWRRQKKDDLITAFNPFWKFLNEEAND